MCPYVVVERLSDLVVSFYNIIQLLNGFNGKRKYCVPT